jgi:hypothetical protein
MTTLERISGRSGTDVEAGPTTSRQKTRNALFTLTGLVVFAGGAKLASMWSLPMPQCWLRHYTGIPCVSCGSTRSTLAWWHGDLLAAFRFNPLFFLICIGLIAWMAGVLLEAALGRRLLPTPPAWARRLPVWKIGVALAFLNWLYLCLTLPK